MNRFWLPLCGVLLVGRLAAGASPTALPPGLGVSPAAAASAGARILAHGDAEQFWVAIREGNFTHPEVPYTGYYVRSPDRPAWRQLARLEGAPVGLASRGSQLAVLQPGGDWMLQWRGGGATGVPLPGNAPIVALGNDAQHLWAIGNLPGSIASLAATAPAATRPQPPARLALFMLDDGAWRLPCDLPTSVLPAMPLSLGPIGGTPYVAYGDAPDSIRVIGYQSSGEWVTAAQLKLKSPVEAFKLLSGTGLPVMWVATRQGPDMLYYLEGGGMRAVELRQFPGEPAQRTAAFAGGFIRLLWLDADRLMQQDYDSRTGAPAAAAPLAVSLTAPEVYRGFWQVMQYLVMAALVFAVLTSMRWRRVMRGMVFDLKQLRLAPIGRRLVAGLIDALPVLAVTPLMAAAPDEAVQSIRHVEIAFAAALALYVLHTAALEAMTGRSIGKMLLGLRVVSLDGTRPGVGSLVARNVLRVIDVGLFFLPLLVIFVSPLRQRTGDVAAGTLVISERRENEKEDEEGESRSED